MTTLWRLAMAVLLAALAAVPLTARAEGPVTVESRVDFESITMGDRVKFTVVARAPEGVTLEAPAPLEALGDFEVLEEKAGTPQRTPDGGSLLRVEYTVTAFKTGPLRLAPPAIHFSDVAGTRGEAKGEPATIAVRSVLGNDPNPQLIDLKPPLTIPGRATSYTQTAATAAMVAAALAITILMLRRRRPMLLRRIPAAAIPATFSIEGAAAAELDDIEAAGLLESGDYDAYYRRISACLRTYMERRHDIAALSLTTTELRREVERHGVDRWQSRVLIGLIEECDSVRWAGYHPADARAARSLIQAREVIEMLEPAAAAP
ncbi:MAG: hypothetical protein NTZ05_03790 [Chloroflexi bacterium]|nr:hypothetical protein [Chloroflexota bacterium]